jgi:hypothetical protein
MVKKAMVAVCDILGFRELVKRSTFEELVSRHIPSILNVQKGIPKKETSVPPTHEQIFGERLVGHVFFSDTVLLYSLSEDKYGYENLIAATAYLIAYPILWPEYRFRVGISYGEFYRDLEHNVYAGKALVEAYELEKSQDWSGGALTKTAERRIREVDAHSYYLVQYNVPFKFSNAESHLAVNWTLAKHDTIDKEFGWLARSYALRLTEQDKVAERKLINTEKFHLEKCVQCRAYRNYLAKTK